jgi:hypothetical protein
MPVSWGRRGHTCPLASRYKPTAVPLADARAAAGLPFS